MVEQKVGPLTGSERVEILDILRGFALLGVLLDNVFSFSGYEYFTGWQRQALTSYSSDALFDIAELVFVRGKFYSLFSLLFGIGFAIILARNEKLGVNPLPIFYRRLTILALIGAAHLFFVWDGDILLFYALIGFILPLFRRRSDRTLLITAGLLLLAPLLFDTLRVLLQLHETDFLYQLAQGIDHRNGLPMDDSISLYLYRPGGGWQEWMNWQQTGYLYRYAYLLEDNRFFKVLGMFLLGLYAGRKAIYRRLADFIPLLKRVCCWGFVVGLPGSIGLAVFELDGYSLLHPAGLLDTLCYVVGVPPLCLAYVASLCLLWQKRRGRRFWKLFGPVGRMALSNYLLQSGLGIALFYSVGLGLGGRLGPTLFLPLALSIFAFQLLFSRWWFCYFNFGPLEWIWRQLTYGKRLPLLKRVAGPG